MTWVCLSTGYLHYLHLLTECCSVSTKHNFKTYSGHEALTSAAIFKKCGVNSALWKNLYKRMSCWFLFYRRLCPTCLWSNDMTVFSAVLWVVHHYYLSYCPNILLYVVVTPTAGLLMISVISLFTKRRGYRPTHPPENPHPSSITHHPHTCAHTATSVTRFLPVLFVMLAALFVWLSQACFYLLQGA